METPSVDGERILSSSLVSIRELEVCKELSYDDLVQEHRSRMRFYDYFNTNPVQVLRSWLLCKNSGLSLDKFIVPYVSGKEHLITLDTEAAGQQKIHQAISARFLAAWGSVAWRPRPA